MKQNRLGLQPGLSNRSATFMSAKASISFPRPVELGPCSREHRLGNLPLRPDLSSLGLLPAGLLSTSIVRPGYVGNISTGIPQLELIPTYVARVCSFSENHRTPSPSPSPTASVASSASRSLARRARRTRRSSRRAVRRSPRRFSASRSWRLQGFDERTECNR